MFSKIDFFMTYVIETANLIFARIVILAWCIRRCCFVNVGQQLYKFQTNNE